MRRAVIAVLVGIVATLAGCGPSAQQQRACEMYLDAGGYRQWTYEEWRERDAAVREEVRKSRLAARTAEVAALEGAAASRSERARAELVDYYDVKRTPTELAEAFGEYGDSNRRARLP